MELMGMLDGEMMDGDDEWGRGQTETLDGDIRRGDVRGERWMGRTWTDTLDGDVGQGGIFFFTTFHRLFHLFSRK